jgi:hypothetical protein
MFKHTPGPWKLLLPLEGTAHKITANLGTKEKPCECVIVSASYAFGTMEIGEGLANAKLIAAAPELLQALEECFHLIKIHIKNAPLVHDSEITALEMARAAIAKAKGE